MGNMAQKTRWAVGGMLFLLSTLPAFAGAPAGHVASIDYKLKQSLMQRLDREGYRVSEEIFPQAVSAYLWDHRDRLTTTSIPNDRQIDVLVCLLSDKDRHGLEEFMSNASFRSWCKDMLKPAVTPTPTPQD